MNIDLISITTSQPQKQNLFMSNIVSALEKYSFNKKIVGVDIAPNSGLQSNFIQFLDDHNFVSNFHPLKGMVNNLSTVINELESDWVLWMEDDVILNKKIDIKKIVDFIQPKINKEVGIIDLMAGRGIGFSDEIADDFKSNALDCNSYYKFEDLNIWVRKPESLDRFFINFPILFIKKNIFQDCFFEAKKNFKQNQIETGFTCAFEKLNFIKKYTKIHLFSKTFDLENFKNLSAKEISFNHFNNALFIDNKDTKGGLDFSANFTLDMPWSEIYSF
jgi:hypothetical protein